MTPSRKTFPLKLWELINDGRFQAALKWADDGKSFYVFESELAKLCLGKENKLFFTKQPKSFIRQLHLYGFRKINKTQFKHYFFSKDDPNSVQNIKRGYKSSPGKTAIETPSTPLSEVLGSTYYNYSSSSSSYTELEQTSICSLCVCARCAL